MTSALHIARTGLDAQDMRMRVVANNLANVNSTGFKRDRAEFQPLSYQSFREPGAASSESTTAPIGLSIGTGVRAAGTIRIHTAGSIIATDSPLDVAIDGNGFFAVTLPDERTAYTRAGAFARSTTGELVTGDGYAVQPGLTIPEGVQSLTIAQDGTVSYVEAGASEPTEAGQFELTDFINPAGLQPIGNNLFVETAGSGVPITGAPSLDGRGRLLQGQLESSNVNLVQELVDLIETQRAYEINSKVISAVDGMLRYATQTL